MSDAQVTPHDPPYLPTSPMSRPERPSRPPRRQSSDSRPPKRSFRPAAKKDTSWEKSAGWYDRIIGSQGSDLYQRVVIPRALALLGPQPRERILDVGCGQGVFSRAMAAAGARVTGVDLSRSLILRARNYQSEWPVHYFERDAADLGGLGPFDAASSILALQNMEHLPKVAQAIHRALEPGGRMLWVLNHPVFRIPKQTSWGWDEETGVQYRRLDAYASSLQIPILMHPGKAESETTLSFHHSLQTLFQAAFQAGFVLAGLEEWCSDKESEPGPRARAENKARQEFPLFIGLLWVKRARA